MKRNMIFAAAFAMVTLNVFAQNDSAIKASVSQRFNEMFPGARSVTWASLRDDFAQVQFSRNGQSWLAYFDAQANLISSGRKVRHDESLPLEITRGITEKKARMEKKYGHLTILHTFEMVTDGVTKYYSTLDNGKICMVITTTPSGYAIVERKEFKKQLPEIRPAPANVIAKKSTD